MSDGDEGQTGLQEATMDSFNNETPKSTENLLHKNSEYLLAQQQEAMSIALNFSDQSSKYFNQQSTNTFHVV